MLFFAWVTEICPRTLRASLWTTTRFAMKRKKTWHLDMSGASESILLRTVCSSLSWPKHTIWFFEQLLLCHDGMVTQRSHVQICPLGSLSPRRRNSVQVYSSSFFVSPKSAYSKLTVEFAIFPLLAVTTQASLEVQSQMWRPGASSHQNDCWLECGWFGQAVERVVPVAAGGSKDPQG